MKVFLVFLVSIVASESTYFLDSRLNCNNVNQAVISSGSSTKYVTYLGKFKNTDKCIDACLNNSTSPSHRCESYTYYTSNKGNNEYASDCYGRFGNILWIPLSQLNINCGRIIYECKDNLSCSLNGICDIETGNCSCSKQWNGYKCDELNVLPATKSNGYNIANVSSWGGVGLYNKSNRNIYHLYISEMINHCGINSWVLNSQIIHTESNNGYNSKYIKKQVIELPFAHEPDTVIYHSNMDQYVMYYTYYHYPSNQTKQCECIDGSTNMSSCQFAPAPLYQEAMIYSDNVYGPWSKPINIWNVREVDTNLAVIILNNGSVIGMSRIMNWIQNNTSIGSQMHLVTAIDWKDNTTYIEHTEYILFPELTVDGTEDPYLYKDCNGKYHAIFHNMDPGDSLLLCGGHAFSEDGINWIYGGYSWNNTVQFIDGDTISFSRRERPHFLFNSNDGCTPIALITGVQYGGQFGDATYTLLQPIQQ